MSTSQVADVNTAMKEEEIERPSSPDPPCPICLDELRNKSFTDSCLHPFCFDCLKEWAKVKAECPLCKQRFTTIIHNIRSINEFDEHRVDPLSRITPPGLWNLIADQTNLPRANIRIRRPPGGILILGEPPFLPSYAVLPSSTSFRRAIYHEGLWVRSHRTNRQRECSPEFFRNNEAQIHRLGPWLTRELSVLLDVSMNIHTIVSEIMELIVAHPITSSTFRNHMLNYIGPRTDHFLHEFYNYAISPEPTMQIYDFNAEYASMNELRISNSYQRLPLLGNSQTLRQYTEDLLVERLRSRRAQTMTSTPEVVVVSDTESSSEGEETLEMLSDTDSDDSVQIIEPPPPKPIEVITLDDSDDGSSEVAASTVNTTSSIAGSEDLYANPQPSTSFQLEPHIPLIVLSSSSSVSSLSTPSVSSSSSEDSSPRRSKRSRSSKKRKRKSKRTRSPSPRRRERKSYKDKPKKSRKNDKENLSTIAIKRRISYSSSDDDSPRFGTQLKSVVLKCNSYQSSLKRETDSSIDSDF